jgi:hypothetical protein
VARHSTVARDIDCGGLQNGPAESGFALLTIHESGMHAIDPRSFHSRGLASFLRSNYFQIAPFRLLNSDANMQTGVKIESAFTNFACSL